MNFLFGIPYYKSKIDPSLYDKEKIISDIAENYNRSSLRNKWNTHMDDNIHHSYNDLENPEFLDIDYEELHTLYAVHISTFMNQIPSLKRWNYNWKIVNYTATANHQDMSFHQHLPSMFHAIHYLKFDSKVHNPTVHQNNWDFATYFMNLYENADIDQTFDLKHLYNSWMCREFMLNTEEDDFIILPSIINHRIKKSCSEELRMTIVMNIDVDKSYIL